MPPAPSSSTVIDLARMTPGLADPVLDAQALFRRILEATARPGRIETLTEAPPPPLDGFRAAGGLALTLLDFETPACLFGALAASELGSWLRFHCGCPFTDDLTEAAFVFAFADQAPPVSALNAGDPKYPEQASTLVLIVPSLTGGPPVELSGPGIDGRIEIAPQGLPAGFWQALADNRAAPPLGVDVIVASQDEIVCLPRTTRCTPL